MLHREFSWISSRDIKIYGQTWMPSKEDGEFKAVVCLVHGLGEHSTRYKILPRVLIKNGYALIAFDQPGHGKSGGKRGHTPDYEAYMDNITALLDKAAKLYPGKDRFLYGHSLGGNLVVNYSLRHKPDIKGVIATGPWFRLTHPPGKFIQKFARWLDKFWPSFRTFNGIKPVYLSSNGVKNVTRERDKYLHPWISVRTYLTAEETGRWALEHAGELQYPILILHGGEDHVTSAESSKQFASKVNTNCTIQVYEGLFHEIHNEPRNQEIFAKIIGWLNSQVNQSVI
ncbi:MAG: lysophospholipase [Bacteroidota bacterium]|nr:lysophospholipase [Bacteroidota bacterium]